MTARTISPKLIFVAIKIAADGPLPKSTAHNRCTVKRSLVEDLRRELDRAGFGDDWRTMQHIIRRQEQE